MHCNQFTGLWYPIKTTIQVEFFSLVGDYEYQHGFGLLSDAQAPCKEEDSLDCYQNYSTEGIILHFMSHRYIETLEVIKCFVQQMFLFNHKPIFWTSFIYEVLFLLGVQPL